MCPFDFTHNALWVTLRDDFELKLSRKKFRSIDNKFIKKIVTVLFSLFCPFCPKRSQKSPY